MARKAAKQLMKKTGANPDDIDLVIVATTTPDYHFPSTASILCDKLGLKNAFAFDLQAACCGFLYLMETTANFIRSGRYKKIIIVGADRCRQWLTIQIVLHALSLVTVLLPL